MPNEDRYELASYWSTERASNKNKEECRHQQQLSGHAYYWHTSPQKLSNTQKRYHETAHHEQDYWEGLLFVYDKNPLAFCTHNKQYQPQNDKCEYDIPSEI
jgi:hypothetical protein